MSTSYNLLTSAEQLQPVLALAESIEPKIFFVDTEFRRENTYYPELSLIQLGVDNEIFLIDAVSVGEEVVPLISALNAPHHTKVYHSAKQDVEIFMHLSGAPHENVFDTQIAALLCGYGEQIALHSLVKQICKEAIDKSVRAIDWMQRPLTPAALDYAANDVRYLPKIYEVLSQRLTKTERLPLFSEECILQLSQEAVFTPPYEAWRKVKTAPNIKLNAEKLIALAAVRERLAQSLNMPRSWVFSDQIIEKLSATDHELSQYMDPAVEEQVLGELPQLSRTLIQEQFEIYKSERQPFEANDAYSLAKLLVRYVAGQERLPESFVAPTRELKLFVQHFHQTKTFLAHSPLLKGWRKTVVGEALQEVLLGNVSLHYQDHKIVFKKRGA